MDEYADSGNILSQSEIIIDYHDNAESLYKKVTQTALEQITKFIPLLINSNYQRKYQGTPQNHTVSNSWRKRDELDGKIDFRMCSYAIYNLTRALTRPYVGAHIDYNGSKIKIWQVTEEKVNLPNIEPGKIFNIQNNIPLVKCSDNAVWLTKHEFNLIPAIDTYFI